MINSIRKFLMRHDPWLKPPAISGNLLEPLDSPDVSDNLLEDFDLGDEEEDQTDLVNPWEDDDLSFAGCGGASWEDENDYFDLDSDEEDED